MSVEDFIAKVKSRPELWQTTHPLYKHRFVASKIWTEISEELGINDCKLVKKRWKHLKDIFRREMKKVMYNEVTMSSWAHYNRLQFLTNELTRKKELSMMSEESEGCSSVDKLQMRGVFKKRYRNGPIISRLDSNAQSSIKFKGIMRSLYTLSKAIDKKVLNKPSEEQFKDTDYMFLMRLLPTMQNMTDIQRLQFRCRINDWLLNALTQNE